MFTTSDDITFGFDEWHRLRIGMLASYRPLAAWLHTDVQSNLAAVDTYIELLRRAQQDGITVNGNGCYVTFERDHITVASRYGRWTPLAVPEGLFWQVLNGLRGFLAGIQGAPGLARPGDRHDVTRTATLRHPANGGPPQLVDHTHFPKEWTKDMIREAGKAAWQSEQARYDMETGAWSGLWQGMELAGYYDPDQRKIQTYFPIMAP